MASSFIAFKKKGYWVSDNLTEFFAKLASEHLEQEKNQLPNWLISLKSQYKDTSKGYFSTFNDLCFDEFLINEDRIFIYKKFLDEIIKKTELLGNSIAKESLNKKLQTNQGRWREDLELKRLVGFIKCLKMIVSEEVETTASSPIDYVI